MGDVTFSTCLMTMIFQFSSGLAFRAHPASASHKFFPRYIRSLSFARSGLVSWPTPTIHKTLLANKPRPLIYKSMALAGLGLSLATWNKPAIRCEAPENQLNAIPENYPPPPVSSISFYELGFGTVTGICAGVFIKKGAKALAFLLGGVFVLLQYLNLTSIVRVDWGRAASKFENLFYTKDMSGIAKPPNVGSLWKGIINFLTADFQPRASFIAGLALGLRIG